MIEEQPTENQPETVRQAHQDWCAEQGVDPASPLGEEAMQIMAAAFRDGVKSENSLVAVCDAYVEQRSRSVRLGTPAIPSSEEQ